MVSNSAIASIEWLYEQAARDNSADGADGACELTVADADPADDGTPRHLIVLSIASYVFRIVAMFSFARDAATAGWMARRVRAQSETIAGQELDDAFAELVNMICGAVNRRLVEHFPHVGMSTPFVLESGCGAHLAMLDPLHVRRFHVALGDSVSYRLTLCLCAGANSEMDFQVDRRVVAEESAGELELF